MSTPNRFPVSPAPAMTANVMTKRARAPPPAPPVVVLRTILDASIKSTRDLIASVFTFAGFTVPKSGSYMITSTACVRRLGDAAADVYADFLQIFVGDVQNPTAFASVQINSDLAPAHTCSASATTLAYLKEGDDIEAHLNFSSDDNSQFEFVQGLSSLKMVLVD